MHRTLVVSMSVSVHHSDVSDSLQPHRLYVAQPGSSVHGISPGDNNWSGLSFPSPGDLPNPVIQSRSLTLQADSFTF